MTDLCAFCSTCVRAYIFPGIVAGAHGFSSIVLSQILGPGNHWAFFSLNTSVWRLYPSGTGCVFCAEYCSASFEAIVWCLPGNET